MSKSRLFTLLLCLPFLAAAKCIDTAQGPGSSCAGCFEVPGGPTSGAEMGVNDASVGKSSIAQSFTTGTEVTVSTVRLMLTAVAPTNDTVHGTLTLKIQTNNAGAPVDDELAVATRAADQITVGASKGYEFTLTTPVALAALTKYWIRLSADYHSAPGATASAVKWLASNTNPLPNGNAAYFEDSSPALSNYHFWSTSKIGDSRDLLFGLNVPE